MNSFRLNTSLAPLMVVMLAASAGCATQSRLQDEAAATGETGMAVANSPLGTGLALIDDTSPPAEPIAGDTAPANMAAADASTADTAAPGNIAAGAIDDTIVTVTVGDTSGTAPAAPAPELPVIVAKPLYQGPIPYTSEMAQSIVSSSVSVWTSKTSSYNYYIGDKLIAEYFEGKGTLAIRPDDAGASGLSCTWDRDNKLKADASRGSSSKDAGKECDRLTRELVTALGTTHTPQPGPEEIAAAAAAAQAAAEAEAAKAKPVSKVETKPAPAVLPPVAPLPTTVEIAKSRMTEHNLALWQSKSKTYNFFVGGLMDAVYAPGSETLTINADTSGERGLSCKYDSDNSLWVKLDKNARVSDPEATCDRLIKELAGKLQR